MFMQKTAEKCVEDSSRATLGATTGEGERHVEHTDRQGDKWQVREVRVNKLQIRIIPDHPKGL